MAPYPRSPRTRSHQVGTPRPQAADNPSSTSRDRSCPERASDMHGWYCLGHNWMHPNLVHRLMFYAHIYPMVSLALRPSFPDFRIHICSGPLLHSLAELEYVTFRHSLSFTSIYRLHRVSNRISSSETNSQFNYKRSAGPR